MGEAAAATFSATSSSQETVLFRDANVSRAHFDIKLLSGKLWHSRLRKQRRYIHSNRVHQFCWCCRQRARTARGHDHHDWEASVHCEFYRRAAASPLTIAMCQMAAGGQRRARDEAKAQSKVDESTTAESGGGGGEVSEAEMLHSVIADAEMLVNRLAEQRKRLEGPVSGDEGASCKMSSPDGRGKGGTTACSKKGGTRTPPRRWSSTFERYRSAGGTEAARWRGRGWRRRRWWW